MEIERRVDQHKLYILSVTRMCLQEIGEQSYGSKCTCPHPNDLSLDITYCNVSGWRQKEQLDDWEIAHLQRFLRVGRVLLR